MKSRPVDGPTSLKSDILEHTPREGNIREICSELKEQNQWLLSSRNDIDGKAAQLINFMLLLFGLILNITPSFLERATPFENSIHVNLYGYHINMLVVIFLIGITCLINGLWEGLLAYRSIPLTLALNPERILTEKYISMDVGLYRRYVGYYFATSNVELMKALYRVTSGIKRLLKAH